ncbi:MAG: hypothetical protein QM528_07120 [Phycisphaerales bacterium]|nr:hypothetical protein [Phycisphaerales bacterium]
MKQKSMRLGSSLTRIESKLVGGQYKTTSCSQDSDCSTACSQYENVACSDKDFDRISCYKCMWKCMYYGNTGGPRDLHYC